MAGYLGNAQQWDAFESDWKAFLSKHPSVEEIGGTHAKDVLRRRGHYHKLPDADYAGFVDEMVNTVVTAGFKAILVTLTNDDFIEFRKWEKAQGRRDKLESAYALCFRMCMCKLAGHVRDFHPSECVSFVVESGHKNAGDAERLFRITKNAPRSSKRFPQLGTFTEASKFDYGGLQAADLIAYCAYRHVQGVLGKNDSRFVSDPVFRKLLVSDLMYETYWLQAQDLYSMSDVITDIRIARNAVSSRL
jgi:hypothetical protein